MGTGIEELNQKLAAGEKKNPKPVDTQQILDFVPVTGPDLHLSFPQRKR